MDCDSEIPMPSGVPCENCNRTELGLHFGSGRIRCYACDHEMTRNDLLAIRDGADALLRYLAQVDALGIDNVPPLPERREPIRY